ncbi:MAG: hypothetical protein NTZ72_13275 [Afipia sp.]|nr:hypothetical protein [Afipia sp.]
MDNSTSWTVAVAIAIVGLLLYFTKPTCREGFTPVIGVGSGWYCAPGYKPQ